MVEPLGQACVDQCKLFYVVAGSALPYQKTAGDATMGGTVYHEYDRISFLHAGAIAVALERAAWSEPVEAGAISARGRLQAAEGQAAELLLAIRSRGCKEAFLANPALLQEGKVRGRP